MRRPINIFLAFCLGVILLTYSMISAHAQFARSDDGLYIGWLDLNVNEAFDASSGAPPVEYGAYSIVQAGGKNLPVVYVIFSSFKGKMTVHGAFRCDKEFSVQTSHTLGLYDIKCIRQDVFGQKTTTLLQYDRSGLYVESN